MLKVVWSELSLQRIEEICEYIEMDSINASIEFANKIFGKEELLKSNPKIGRIVPDYGNEEYRQIIIGNYRLVYRLIGKLILIHTVRHCKQNGIIE
jgi:plasmid stabilization system protein ParE